MLILLSTLLGQDYLNVETGSGYQHALLTDILQITFSADGSTILFEMKNGQVAQEPLDNIVQMLFDPNPQGDQSLPVELSSFTAVQTDDGVTLFWETASEVNNMGFDIERKNEEWEKIGFVLGEGNSSSPVSYTYVDENVSGKQNLQYRLKQIDTDGTYEYSPVVFVTLEEIALPIEFKLHHNYPNPFNPETTIAYEIAKENITTLLVYDMQGKLVEILVNENQFPGRYKLTFQANNYASGVYFCKLNSGNQQQLIKMLLMK